MKLLVGIAVLLTVANAAQPSCAKAILRTERCLRNGFVPRLMTNCKIGEIRDDHYDSRPGSLRACNKMERHAVRSCDFQCETAEEPGWSKEDENWYLQVGDVESFSLRYNPGGDKYLISVDGAPDEELDSYNSLAYNPDGIFRKVEYDWNTVYLARPEGSTDEAVIVWAIDCSKPIKSAKISMSHNTFENGEVLWSVNLPEENSKSYPRFSDIDLSKLIGATWFTITATLSGETPAHITWQHTQLFRATYRNDDSTPFDVYLTF